MTEEFKMLGTFPMYWSISRFAFHKAKQIMRRLIRNFIFQCSLLEQCSESFPFAEMNIFAWWTKIVAELSSDKLPRKDIGQAFGVETCIIRPSLQINYDVDFFHLEWTHEEISSLQVSAVFITGLCNHSFVFSPFSQSIY